jgi:Holliday junction resolvasome RuvABC endonuclease subunit
MRRVAGIDLSLTCTGVAVCVENSDGATMTTDTVTSKGVRAATLIDRHARLVTLADAIVSHADRCDLAVIEAPTPATKGGSPIDRHALWWFVVGALIRREVPVASIVGSSLKLAIAGKGNCDKAALAVAMERLWPGMDVSSSDVSDAAGLAHLGAVWLGMDVPTLERHRTVKAEWPSTPDPRIEAAA